MRLSRLVMLAVGAVLLGSLGVGTLVGSTGRQAASLELARARRGDLALRVVASGTLTAPRSVTIASEIQSNRAKVVRLVPEGSFVEPGDLLVEFDPTPFEEAVTKLARAVQEAEANRVQTEQDLAMARTKGVQEAEDAEMRSSLADLELRTLEEGGHPLTTTEARARLEQSAEQLRRAVGDAADAEAFLREGFITRKEYEESAARLADARRFRDVARAQYENLVEFHHPAELERRRANVARARREVEATVELADGRTRRLEAQEAKAAMAVEAARADLERAEQELERTRLLSPAAGVLVYDEISVGSEYRKIQIGDSVWQGQAIMTIPDTSRMAVESFIREYDVHRVRPGQRTVVRLEAYPGAVLGGEVEFIGNLATKREGGEREKYFSLRVLLDATELDVRPGMTARVEIETARVEGALLVPVEAVFTRDARPFVAVAEGAGLVEREIEVGESDARSVVVRAGLSEGETVRIGAPGGGVALELRGGAR